MIARSSVNLQACRSHRSLSHARHRATEASINSPPVTSTPGRQREDVFAHLTYTRRRYESGMQSISGVDSSQADAKFYASSKHIAPRSHHSPASPSLKRSARAWARISKRATDRARRELTGTRSRSWTAAGQLRVRGRRRQRTMVNVPCTMCGWVSIMQSIIAARRRDIAHQRGWLAHRVPVSERGDERWVGRRGPCDVQMYEQWVGAGTCDAVGAVGGRA